MRIKRFICCLAVMLFFPYGFARHGTRNIAEARLVEQAPRQAVTVVSKWSRPINARAVGYWIRFQERVATPQEVQITSEEWESLGPGSRITIAVLPDGRPHTLKAGQSVRFEQIMFVFGVGVWVGATAYVLSVVYRWVRSKRH